MVLGNFEMRQGRLAEARSGAEEALALFLELKDRLGEANTRQVLAIVDSMEPLSPEPQERTCEL